VFRDELFPQPVFRRAWEMLDERLEPRKACRVYVGLLHLAAMHGCETALADHLAAVLDTGGVPDLEAARAAVAPPRPIAAPAVTMPAPERPTLVSRFCWRFFVMFCTTQIIAGSSDRKIDGTIEKTIGMLPLCFPSSAGQYQNAAKPTIAMNASSGMRRAAQCEPPEGAGAWPRWIAGAIGAWGTAASCMIASRQPRWIHFAIDGTPC
jgi:hypothetical protein